MKREDVDFDAGAMAILAAPVADSGLRLAFIQRRHQQDAAGSKAREQP